MLAPSPLHSPTLAPYTGSHKSVLHLKDSRPEVELQQQALHWLSALYIALPWLPDLIISLRWLPALHIALNWLPTLAPNNSVLHIKGSKHGNQYYRKYTQKISLDGTLLRYRRLGLALLSQILMLRKSFPHRNQLIRFRRLSPHIPKLGTGTTISQKILQCKKIIFHIKTKNRQLLML